MQLSIAKVNFRRGVQKQQDGNRDIWWNETKASVFIEEFEGAEMQAQNFVRGKFPIYYLTILLERKK